MTFRSLISARQAELRALVFNPLNDLSAYSRSEQRGRASPFMERMKLSWA